MHVTNGLSFVLSPPSTPHTQIADRVGLMRVPEFNGSLVIFINGEAIGIVAKGIPEKMYGFVELQNDCDRVCITRCHAVKLVSFI